MADTISLQLSDRQRIFVAMEFKRTGTPSSSRGSWRYSLMPEFRSKGPWSTLGPCRTSSIPDTTATVSIQIETLTLAGPGLQQQNRTVMLLRLSSEIEVASQRSSLRLILMAWGSSKIGPMCTTPSWCTGILVRRAWLWIPSRDMKIGSDLGTWDLRTNTAGLYNFNPVRASLSGLR